MTDKLTVGQRALAGINKIRNRTNYASGAWARGDADLPFRGIGYTNLRRIEGVKFGRWTTPSRSIGLRTISSADRGLGAITVAR